MAGDQFSPASGRIHGVTLVTRKDLGNSRIFERMTSCISIIWYRYYYDGLITAATTMIAVHSLVAYSLISLTAIASQN